MRIKKQETRLTLQEHDGDDGGGGGGGGGGLNTGKGEKSKLENIVWGCKNSRWQVAMATSLRRFGSNICDSSEWNLLQVTILVPKILSWILDFCKVCTPLRVTVVVHSIL